MLGPRALTTHLRDGYLSYLFSANPIGVHNPELRMMLEGELRQSGLISRGPILELDPASRRMQTVADLVKEGSLHEPFIALPHRKVADIRNRQLYRHQVDAIRASAAGRSVAVASGTGSGKTECWLFPALDAIAMDPSPGLRAIVLYPMNALADDQRRDRLRSAIGGSQITYGEYTGNTKGDEDPAAPSNELQTREKMRRTPPNILITNPSMLEYLLLRPEDADLFRGANLQFLVIDEAHTYRGAYAIELAHLLRRFKARLGIREKDVRAFVLSATIERRPEGVAAFAQSLTGEPVAAEDVFFGEAEVAPVPGSVFVPPETYTCFTREVLDAIADDPIRLLDAPGIMAFGEDRVNRAASASRGSRALWELLHEDGHVAALRMAIADGPRDISELCGDIFGSHDVDVDETLGRLVDAASMAREDEESSPLLPARFHVFLRGLDGLSVCFNEEHGAIGEGPYQVGTFFLNERTDCDCGARVWDLLTCTDCAAWYVREPSTGRDIDEDRGPENAFLLVRDSSEADEDEEVVDDERCMICRNQGAACGCPRPAKRRTISVKKRSCLLCGSRRVGRVMTGTMAPTQIIAEELTRAQSPDNQKILAFSDSRGSAAEFAAGLQRSMRQHVNRASIYHALQKRGLEDRLGFKFGAKLVNTRLLEANALKDTADSLYEARGILFAEFTSSYATRRRTGSLGLLATQIKFQRPTPAELTAMFAEPDDARIVAQSLLEIMQYDSAVTQPQDMILPDDLQVAKRGDVRLGLDSGDKRFLPKSAHAKKQHRSFNYAARIVGEENAELLLRRVWNYANEDGALVGPAGSALRQIDGDRIEIFAPDHWYRCSQCRRLSIWSLSDGRGCQTKNCDGTFVFDSEPVDKTDHYTRNVIELTNLLEVQEHTAQLESKRGRDVGERFRNGNINILSCSTTFELGVDIGTLQSVFMRNVPPTVANYRQRAGRAGRSRRAPAFLVTYCGPNPHDRVFFREPEHIIVGDVPIPKFNIANGVLSKRHVNSFFFASLWHSARGTFAANLTAVKSVFAKEVLAHMAEWASTAGETLREQFALYRAHLDNCIGPIETELRRFVADFSEEAERYEERRRELEAIIAQPGAAVHAKRELTRLEDRRIIDHLTARAFLPGYAFPIYAVELRTTDNAVILQRDLRIGITEYAPGNQVVADKKLFSSIAVGLRGPTAGAPTPFRQAWTCSKCETIYAQNPATCSCGNDDMDALSYVIPDGFLTDMTASPREAVARAKRERAKPRQYIFASTGEAGVPLQYGPLVARTFRDTEFLFVNRGGKQGFLICERCGKALERAGNHKSAFGKDCAGFARRTSLAHQVLGEAMSIRFESSDDFHVPNDDAFRNTLLYAILGGIARALAIEDRDLGGQVRQIASGSSSWEVVVVDNVPGGAGYIDQVCTKEALERSLVEAERIVDCECDPETTCYGCVNTLWNQHLHGTLQRGPVLTFIRALRAKLSGRPVLLGMTIDKWLDQHVEQDAEVVITSPRIDDALLVKIQELAPTSRITLLVSEDRLHEENIALAAWSNIWRDRVVVRAAPVSSTFVAVRKVDGRWFAIEDGEALRLQRDSSVSGAEAVPFEEAALRAIELRKAPIWTNTTGDAEHIAFPRNTRTNVRSSFGHLFTKAVKSIRIEDRYIKDAAKMRRVAEWASLPANTDCVVSVVTMREGDPARAREQQRLLADLKARLGRGGRTLSWETRWKNETKHDRRIVIQYYGDEPSVTIVLPYGLDFMDDNGLVRESTDAFISRSAEPARV